MGVTGLTSGAFFTSGFFGVGGGIGFFSTTFGRSGGFSGNGGARDIEGSLFCKRGGYGVGGKFRLLEDKLSSSVRLGSFDRYENGF